MTSGDLLQSSGYVILKPEKELQHKLHRAVWDRNFDKVRQLLEENRKKGKIKHSIKAQDKGGR